MQRALFFLGGITIELTDAPASAPSIPDASLTPEGIAGFLGEHLHTPAESIEVALPSRAGREAGRAAAEAACRLCVSTRLRHLRFIVPGNFDELLAGAESFLVQMTAKTFRNPVPTVDIIIRHLGGIVLVRRKNFPFGWAIPGGFVDYGESLEEAAAREAREETGLLVSDLTQFHTYSRPERDPRYHTITTVFTARGAGTLHAADDAEAAGVFTAATLPSPLVFDHAAILADYFGQERNSEHMEV